MQFSDFAGIFASGAQLITCKELRPLCDIMLYSYLKVLLVSRVHTVVQNELRLTEKNPYSHKKDSLLAIVNTFQG